ncbi:hypothetical protein PR003_g6062 [Phytophthora rubi]|uniref:Uncharacterized protein n=1 Tax=Phytophthora rubi TaxID=129364 RepID=A0A6A4FQN6_9STRA|nr:hypothetical protein PR001_g6274 [Phytophthora rubi]KAE9349084.1 hypothetical protein PR003_g6062 [Phytophthora rubi]
MSQNEARKPRATLPSSMPMVVVQDSMEEPSSSLSQLHLPGEDDESDGQERGEQEAELQEMLESLSRGPEIARSFRG